jgi:hypothetical protein
MEDKSMVSDDVLKGAISGVVLLGATKIITDAAFKKPRRKRKSKRR